MEGMRPSGINLSGNVPLRLEKKKKISYRARDTVKNILGQKSTGRIRIDGIENAHLGLSEMTSPTAASWRCKNGALQRRRLDFIVNADGRT
jgi:hypothetical protein